tara:strand:- start:3056 stop:3190 length:135 start_codon:yes stop_codon:yes gene_type:complete
MVKFTTVTEESYIITKNKFKKIELIIIKENKRKQFEDLVSKRRI